MSIDIETEKYDIKINFFGGSELGSISPTVYTSCHIMQCSELMCPFCARYFCLLCFLHFAFIPPLIFSFGDYSRFYINILYLFFHLSVPPLFIFLVCAFYVCAVVCNVNAYSRSAISSLSTLRKALNHAHICQSLSQPVIYATIISLSHHLRAIIQHRFTRCHHRVKFALLSFAPNSPDLQAVKSVL